MWTVHVMGECTFECVHNFVEFLFTGKAERLSVHVMKSVLLNVVQLNGHNQSMQ